jgi:hypothetical protein
MITNNPKRHFSSFLLAASVADSAHQTPPAATVKAAFAHPLGLAPLRKPNSAVALSHKNSRFLAPLPAAVQMQKAKLAADAVSGTEKQVNRATSMAWDYLSKPSSDGIPSPDGYVWIGGDFYVEADDLMHNNIPELKLAMHVAPEDLQLLEQAVSHQGLGAAFIHDGLPLNEIVFNLGYTTEQGILALCEVEEARNKALSLLQVCLDANVSDASDKTGADAAQQVPSAMGSSALSSASPRSPTLSLKEARGMAAVSMAIQAAIEEGQSLAEIVSNPFHQCVTAADIRAIYETRQKHLQSYDFFA